VACFLFFGEKKSIIENCLLQTLEFVFHRLLLNTRQVEDDNFEQSLSCYSPFKSNASTKHLKQQKSHF